MVLLTTSAIISLRDDCNDRDDIEPLNLDDDVDDASVPFLPWSSSGRTRFSSVDSSPSSNRIRLKVCAVGVICFIGSIFTLFQVIDVVVVNDMNAMTSTTTKLQQQQQPRQHHVAIERSNSNIKGAVHDYHSYTGQRSFPRWGNSIMEEQENGIFFPPILNFIQNSSPYKGHPINSQYYRPTTDHSKASKTILPKLPETVYIIQPSPSYYFSRNDDSLASIDDIPPLLYSSNLHRLQHGPAVAIGNETLDRRHKVNITERIMLHAIQTLHHVVMSYVNKNDRQRGQGNNEICSHTPWPSLCHNLYPSLSKLENTTTTSHVTGGFPFLAWYGDYTGCNFHNWIQLDQNDTEPITPQDLVTKNTQHVSLPLFTVAAQSHCNFTVPFPNFYQISESMDHSTEWDRIIDQYRNEYPWSTKISKIVWRGSLTGRIDNNITKCPRWTMVQSIHHIETQRRELHKQLLLRQDVINTTKTGVVVQESVSLSPDYHEMFDAKITYVPDGEKQYQNQLEHDIGDQPIVHSRLEFHEFQKYRGIIDIDGHSWSGRFGALLCLNSIILKVDPEYVEYFYVRKGNNKNYGNYNDDDHNHHDSEIRAWKHYIPIRDDFSNLEEMAEYVLDPVNDDTIQEIVHNANDWCRQNMITSTIMYDMLDVWDRYVELLNINNNNWSEQYWTADIQASIVNDSLLNLIVLNVSDYPILKE